MRTKARRPRMKNGRKATHQKIAHGRGRKPSMMCMAWADWGSLKARSRVKKPTIRTDKNLRLTNNLKLITSF
ncbi:hypothetical protein D3C73_1449720 [compost metagenome]